MNPSRRTSAACTRITFFLIGVSSVVAALALGRCYPQFFPWINLSVVAFVLGYVVPRLYRAEISLANGEQSASKSSVSSSSSGRMSGDEESDSEESDGSGSGSGSFGSQVSGKSQGSLTYTDEEEGEEENGEEDKEEDEEEDEEEEKEEESTEEEENSPIRWGPLVPLDWTRSPWRKLHLPAIKDYWNWIGSVPIEDKDQEINYITRPDDQVYGTAVKGDIEGGHPGEVSHKFEVSHASRYMLRSLDREQAADKDETTTQVVMGKVTGAELRRFPNWYGTAYLRNEAEFQAYHARSRILREATVVRAIRNPDSLGIDGRFFITKQGMKDVKYAWQHRSGQTVKKEFEEQMKTLSRNTKVAGGCRAESKDDLPDYLYYVLQMKGCLDEDAPGPVLGVEKYVTFGGQSLSNLHLEAIEKFFDEWLEYESEWQAQEPAVPTFECKGDSVANGFCLPEMDCKEGKLYFKLGLLEFIDEQMGGMDDRWFPDLWPVRQENYVTIHHALKFLGKLKEESSWIPDDMDPELYDPVGNGWWRLVNGKPLGIHD